MRVLVLVFTLCSSVWAAEPSLPGNWLYYKKIYEGREMPEPPSATLRIRYDFDAAGKSHLYWWHEGENQRCARRGEYAVEGNEIVDKATRIDPENSPDCASDPDMQPDRTTRTRFAFAGPDLQLFLPLGDSELVYVWKRVKDEEFH